MSATADGRTTGLVSSLMQRARNLRTDHLVFRDLPGHSKIDQTLDIVALIFLLVQAQSEASTTSDVLLAVFLFASWLPLLARSRWPLLALVAVVSVECVHLVVVPLTDPVQFDSIPVSVLVAAYTLARKRDWRTAWRAGGAAALVLLIVGVTARDGALAANMFALDLVLAATGAGVLVRSRLVRLEAMEHRAFQAEQAAEAEARRQVANERIRMARELHDVVAHHLTLVNAQSSVAEYLVRSDPEAAARALQDLTKHTRQALDELRATVGLLRQDGDEPDGDGRESPMPGVADLPALVESQRVTGLDVTLSAEGQVQELPALADLAAFRITQEALTNARKHAPDCSAAVRLTWTTTQLRLEVTNTPSASAPTGHRGPGTNHGILGMRERARASHGDLIAAPTLDGGYQVIAHLPIQARTPAEE